MTINIIIIICLLLLVAYLFDLTSAKTKIPSVILLLFLGYGLRQIIDLFSYKVPDLSTLLPILGTLGLILIVLEGALELDLNKSKLSLVKKSFFGSLASVIILSIGIGFLISYMAGVSLSRSLINVIPISVISSSVAISSAKNLSKDNKEFVIYESSLSDIIGAVFFNFMVFNETIHINSFLQFGFHVIIICVISFFATIGLAFLLRKIDHPIKHAPIIILIILIYGLSEIFHLPALIFILFFGLFLNNIDELKEFNWIRKLNPYVLNKEVAKFRDIVMEGTFLIRAFFFILFGFSLETKEIINLDSLGLSVLIFVIIVVVRAVILKISKLPIIPLLFVAPRGLITILLFLAIPGAQAVSFVNKSLIVQLIILMVLFMMIGLIFSTGKKKEKVGITEETAAGNDLSEPGIPPAIIGGESE